MNGNDSSGLVTLPAVPELNKRLTVNGEAEAQPEEGTVTEAHNDTLLVSEVV